MTSTRCSHCRAAAGATACPTRIAFLVAGRADLDDARLVAGADIHGLRRDVHPADVIGVRAADELRVVIVHPVGIRLAQPRPIIRRTLRVAGEPDKFVVEPDAAGARAALEFRLAKTGA